MVKGDLVDSGDAESSTIVDDIRGAVVGNWDQSGCWCGRDQPGREPKGDARQEHRHSFLAFREPAEREGGEEEEVRLGTESLRIVRR